MPVGTLKTNINVSYVVSAAGRRGLTQVLIDKEGEGDLPEIEQKLGKNYKAMLGGSDVTMHDYKSTNNLS